VQVIAVPHAVPSGALAWAHPVVGRHESIVHGFASSQFVPEYVQLPAVQASSVQALLSLQSAAVVHPAQPGRMAWTQMEWSASHESSVQALPSSQF
jgi:hypothetical protein